MAINSAVDTSVLVAGVLSWHAHHAASHHELEALAQANPGPILPAHVLLESYSVLTRMPAPHRLAPDDTQALLRGSFGEWKIVGAPADTWKLLDELAVAGIAGGAVYDALIVDTALAAGAGELVTWNITHFERAARGKLTVRKPR